MIYFSENSTEPWAPRQIATVTLHIIYYIYLLVSLQGPLIRFSYYASAVFKIHDYILKPKGYGVFVTVV